MSRAATSKAAAEAQRLHAHGRVLARPVTNLMLDELARLIEQFEGDYLMSLIDLSIIQATRPTGNPEVDDTRAISALAIGRALGLPYETCRRKVRDLEAAGLCRRVSTNRLAVARGRLENPAYRAQCDARWRNLRLYLVELRDIGFDLNEFGEVSPQTAVKAPNLSRTIAWLMDDFILRMQEARITNEEDAFNSLVMTALSNMNGETIRADRELTWMYAGGDTPPPDSLRTPVTIAMLARRVKISEDVIGRRVNAYLQRGWISRVHGGYMHVMAKQVSAEAHESRNLMNLRFLQFVQALRLLGVDPATVTAD